MRIRVKNTIGIQEHWRGIELDVLPPEDAKRVRKLFDPMSSSGSGYIVSGPDALAALVRAGRPEAAAEHCNPEPPSHLEFPKSCCDVI